VKKIIITSALVSLLLTTNFKNKENITPIKGRDYVPNEQTAIKVAEAIWLPIFGESIYENKPFTAHLEGNIWLVTGTVPAGSFGGAATIEIRKSDCKILSVTRPK